ncbi:MAG: ImmA/IrrE family metallo-endopeptidase [Planctomycetes bacterium]|nr:ImmA/IrrE family metallo-endopeptidase [Planctomycetota bacterium]
MHHRELTRLSNIPHQVAMATLKRGAFNHQIYEDTEWQADAFSAAFLMPAGGLEALRLAGRLDPYEVAAHYNVTLSAANRRIRTFSSRRLELLDAIGYRFAS